MKRAALRADLLLFLVAVVWGSGFVAQHYAAESMGPLTFNALRYLVGLSLVAVIILCRSHWKPTRSELLGGAVLGLIMAGAAWLQQAGIPDTSAARAGFFTGLYVLLVPIVGLVFGQRARRAHIAGASVAAVGLWLLSGDLAGGLNKGDPLIIACAVLWALHVVLIARLAPKADPLRLAAVQFATVAVLSGGLVLPLEHDQLGTITDGLLPMAYSGVFVIGIAFTLQIIGQRSAPPTHAAVLLSMEAVFAAVFGLLLLGQGLNAGELIGCGLMLAGAVLSQVWPHKRTPAEMAELTDAVR